MTENYLVSIGIPFYNCEKYLEFAIKSVINQSYTNWELILLNDGSTDNSLNIVRQFTDKRIRIVSDNENKGLVYRLNELTRLAVGNYYARMDADDIMHYNRIETQLEFMINNPDVDVVGSNYFSIDISNNVIGITNVNPSPDSVNSVLKYGCFAHPSVMGKTEWFRNNKYDEKHNTMMEDYELWLRTVTFSNFKNLKEPLLYYRSVGVPTIKKYIRQTYNVNKVLKQRRKYKLSVVESLYYSALNYLKIALYVVFYIFGQIDYLIKMRSQKMDNKMIELSKQDLLKSIQ